MDKTIRNYVIASILAITIPAINIIPAFAVVNTYPPYSNCDLVIFSSNDVAGCTASTGLEVVYSQPSSTSDGTAIVYMYGSAHSITSGKTVTLSSISADIKGRLSVATGGTSAAAHVVAYLDDPSCTKPWRCALGGSVTTLLSQLITSGSWSTLATYTAPNIQYTISTTANYNVVAYLDGQASGVGTFTYADFSNFHLPGAYVQNFKITETF